MIGELGSCEEGGGGNLVHVKETKLGDDVNNTVLGGVLHQDWEVTILHLNVRNFLELLGVGSGLTNFNDLESVLGFSLFLLTADKEGVLVVDVVGDGHLGEAS